MIDLETETPVSLTEATKTIPGRPSTTTLWRWRSHGISGVRLETVCIGGRTYTSREAIARFFEQVTAAKTGQPAQVRTNRQRQAQQSAARRQLKEAGLLE